jgi:lipopolysaccharide export system permease protein
MKILQRYLARELVFPFAMGVMIFTFILVMDKIFTLSDLIIKYGVSVWTVVKLLVYILPSTFAITVPMGCLVAVIVAFARLKGDNELMAMKASGVSLLPSLGVALAFGALLAGGMLAFDDRVLPSANLAYKELYYDVVSKRASIVIREHVFVDDFDGYSFRVGEMDPISGELGNIVVFVLGRRDTDPVRTILAERGRLVTDRVSRRVMLKLENGFMQMVQTDRPESYSRLEFESNVLDLDINHALQQGPTRLRSAREMSMSQILDDLHKGRPSGEAVNTLWVEYHKKMSIPFACLVFVLVGAPLGILAPRSGKFWAYFIGVALIFLYYIFLSLGETFGNDGRMPPFLAMWLPNLCLTGFGLYGVWWVVNERLPGLRRRRRRAA